MKIYRLYALGVISLFLLFGLNSLAFAFRCGTQLVGEGDSRYEVQHKCGEPDHIEYWEEERIQRDFGLRREYDKRSGQQYWTRTPLFVKEKVRVEEWTYNPGPTEFIRYLRFENGILTDISTGDKGF
ncbi:MAG: DUF2845 domain-containing protein [Deltaproteobacteria bacterium]